MSGLHTGTRDLVCRHIHQTAVRDVFGGTMTDIAEAVGCTRDRVRCAIKSLVRDGILTVETRGSGRLPSEYRILGQQRIVAAPEAPPPQRNGAVRPAVFRYATANAVDGEFEARASDVARGCGITTEQARQALKILQRDGVLKQLYRGTTKRLSRYQIVGSPYDNAAEPAVPRASRAWEMTFRAEPAVPTPSRAWRVTFRAEPLVPRPVERVRLVAPGTYKTRGFSMLGGTAR